MTISAFKKTIWNYYKKYGRDLPWRNGITPYRIVVSEIMLQQTQADRVAKKFDSFLKKFPDFKTLAKATLGEVLSEWQGLGYNRRALNLHRLAQTVITNHDGKLPETAEELVELPGIGPNTAGSILAFAFNIPHPFIETNIRSVFIHFFFKGKKKKVHDKELMPLIEKALTDARNSANPREWHFALMDYGVFLKKHHVNPSRKSLHHQKQSTFKGSNRELRSHILKFILEKAATQSQIVFRFPDKKSEAIIKNLNDLEKEGFISEKNGRYSIPGK